MHSSSSSGRRPAPSRDTLRQRSSDETRSRRASAPSEQRGENPQRTSQTTNRRPYTKKKKLKLLNVGLGVDMPFMILVLVLLTIGILMMFSASYPFAYAEENDSYYYLKRQLLFAVFGVGAMIGLSFVNYHVFFKYSKQIIMISFAVLFLVLLMPASGGVHRWISLGIFSFQASEVSKFCVIVFMAALCTRNADKMEYMKYSLMPGGLLFILTAFFLVLEPHFSCIVIMFLLILVMLFLGGMPTKYFVGVFVVVGVVVAIALATGILGYAMDRMDGWGKALVYENDDQWQATWQTRNSIYAIGSGGVWGLGLGNSRQKYLYIPEPQNDFVFSVVCEELGLVGAIAILSLFALLVWRGFYLSQRCSDIFGKLLGCGLSAQIGLQVILNILVITDWLPNTGISLPFFSYGGTSLVMLLAQMGVVLSVSRRSRMEKV